jgi:hypothetical protein
MYRMIVMESPALFKKAWLTNDTAAGCRWRSRIKG